MKTLENSTKLIEDFNKKYEIVKNFLTQNCNKLYIDTSDNEYLPSQANIVCSDDNLKNFLIELVYHLPRGIVYKILVDNNLNQIADKYKFASIDKNSIVSIIYETLQHKGGVINPKKDLIRYEFKSLFDNVVTDIASGCTTSKNEFSLLEFANSEEKNVTFNKLVEENRLQDKELSSNLFDVATVAFGQNKTNAPIAVQPANN